MADRSGFDRELRRAVDERLRPAVGGNSEGTRNARARRLLIRVLLLRFLQERGWIDGNQTYLQDRLTEVRGTGGHAGRDLFRPLFEALGTGGTDPITSPSGPSLGQLPYLGGPFVPSNSDGPVPDPASVDPAFFRALLDPTLGEDGRPRGVLCRYEFDLDGGRTAGGGCGGNHRGGDSRIHEGVVGPVGVTRAFEMAMDDSERSKKGAFYTPPAVAEYVTRAALARYLAGATGASKREAAELLTHGHIPDETTARECYQELRDLTVLDPAAGGGAFAVTVLDAMVEATAALATALGEPADEYALARKFVAESLYGVDIDPTGVELCRFRVWLRLLAAAPDNPSDIHNDGPALPNLDRSFFVGNALVGDHNPTRFAAESGVKEVRERAAACRREYPTASGDRRWELDHELRRLVDELDDVIEADPKMATLATDVSGAFRWSCRVPQVVLAGGFDVVVGNPPYEGRSKQGYEGDLAELYDRRYDFYERVPGMRPDRYQQFVVRGWELTREGGVLAYIMSDTFLTIRSKRATRNLLQREGLTDLVRAGDVFNAAVDTAVFVLQRGGEPGRFTYVDASRLDSAAYPGLVRLVPGGAGTGGGALDDEFLEGTDVYRPHVECYRRNLGAAFFRPTQTNRRLYREYLRPARSLAEEWRGALRDARAQERRREAVEREHLDGLEPGDVTLLGLVTTGGVGIQVPRNDEHLAYIAGSEPAQKVRERNHEFRYVERNDEGYWRMSRVVTPDQIADASSLTPEERRRGIAGDVYDPVWVPIEKGTGGAFYREPVTYIDWRRKAVTRYREHPDAYLRNLTHYFGEGIFAAGQGNGDPEFRYTNHRVIDHSGNVLLPITDRVTVEYLLGVLCSSLASHLVGEFVNHSVNTQLSDFRRLPVCVPKAEQCERVEKLVKRAIAVRRDGEETDLRTLRARLDETVADIYGVDKVAYK